MPSPTRARVFLFIIYEQGIMKKYAQEMDRKDSLAKYKDKFYISDPDLIYLDGNSLGRLPKETIKISHSLLEDQWGSKLIRGWGEGWLNSPERIGGKIAEIIGAKPEEVIVADSTSVNLFKLVVSALKFQNRKTEIITDDLNFPSDLYVIDSAINLLDHRHTLEIIKSDDGIYGPEEKIISKINNNTSLVTLSHTVFKSGFTYDLEKISDAAHKQGALTLFDLSHSAGALPINLNNSKVDLAVGCTYKYLNGGPGAPAFIYINNNIREEIKNHVNGWMGKDTMFDFALKYKPDPGIRQFLTGSVPVMSTSLIEPGVDMIIEAGIQSLRKKSVGQSEFLLELWEKELKDIGFSLESPRETFRRGSHVSLGHEEGWRIDQSLIHDMNVIPDFRSPNLLRLGITPLYTSYMDIFEAVRKIKLIVTNKIYLNYSEIIQGVT